MDIAEQFSSQCVTSAMQYAVPFWAFQCQLEVHQPKCHISICAHRQFVGVTSYTTKIINSENESYCQKHVKVACQDGIFPATKLFYNFIMEWQSHV